MTRIIDPFADEIWGAVSVVETAAGAKKTQPQTDADWLALKERADALAAGFEALASRPQVVPHPEQPLDDASVPGARSAADIQRQINAEPEQFAAYATQARMVALDISRAITARDLNAVERRGSELDEACEACHAAYWYPHATPKPMPSFAEFGRIAARPDRAGTQP